MDCWCGDEDCVFYFLLLLVVVDALVGWEGLLLMAFTTIMP